VGKKLRFGESLLLSSVNRMTQSESSLFAGYTAAGNAPYFQIYNPAGPLGYNPENNATRGPGASAQNLVMRTDTRVNETRIITRKVLGSVYGELEILKGLTYKITGGFDYNVGSGDFFQEAIAFDGGTPRSSILVQERPIELTTNLSHTLTFNRSFGNHTITLLAGEEETNFRFDKARLQGNNLFNTNIRFASTGRSVSAANEADHWALRGWLGRVNYSFKDKYLLTVNVRNDNTSRFAEANRSQTFPSVSAGWRLSEEAFFPKTNLFYDVKLRASWGQSGNQFTGANFAFLPILQTTIFYPIGTGQVITRAPAPITFANSELRWETSNQLDIGADIAMFGGKLEVTFDYYDKVTKDVLIGLPIPLTSGYFLPADANVGRILNRGIELSTNYRSSFGKFNYSLGGNITTVHNQVLDLGASPPIITGVGGASTHRTIEGEPLGHFYGFKTDGIYQTQEEVDAALPDAFSSSRAPGDIRFVDVNGDGRVDANDRTRSATPTRRSTTASTARLPGWDSTCRFCCKAWAASRCTTTAGGRWKTWRAATTLPPACSTAGAGRAPAPPCPGPSEVIPTATTGTPTAGSRMRRSCASATSRSATPFPRQGCKTGRRVSCPGSGYTWACRTCTRSPSIWASTRKLPGDSASRRAMFRWPTGRMTAVPRNRVSSSLAGKSPSSPHAPCAV
jgi:hypothetical protein